MAATATRTGERVGPYAGDPPSFAVLGWGRARTVSPTMSDSPEGLAPSTPAQPPPPPSDAGPGRRGDEDRRVPFSVLDGLLLAVWTILAQFVVLVPLVAAGVDVAGGGVAMLSILVAVQVVALLVAVGYLAARGRLTRHVLGPRRTRRRHLASGLVGGLVGFVGVTVLLQLAMLVLGPVSRPRQTVLESIGQGGAATAVAVLIAVIGAPVLEELVFRGVLFQALRSRAGVVPAAVLSGLAFAGVHLEITQPLFSVSLVALGAWFAWIFHRSGSLLVPVVAHATYNGIAVVITLAVVG